MGICSIHKLPNNEYYFCPGCERDPDMLIKKCKQCGSPFACHISQKDEQEFCSRCNRPRIELVRAGFDIMVILGLVDDHLEAREKQIIDSYLDQHIESDAFDVKQEAYQISCLTAEGKLSRFVDAADFIQENASLEFKYHVVDVCIVITANNGAIDEDVAFLVFMLGKKWSIDLVKYLQGKNNSNG